MWNPNRRKCREPSSLRMLFSCGGQEQNSEWKEFLLQKSFSLPPFPADRAQKKDLHIGDLPFPAIPAEEPSPQGQVHKEVSGGKTEERKYLHQHRQSYYLYAEEVLRQEFFRLQQ